MLVEGGDITISHRLMNIVRCPTQQEGYYALHQQHDATDPYPVTQFSVVKILNLHILAVAVTCHLHKE
jgi:hypothetical protein